jgi:hypothetical protein
MRKTIVLFCLTSLSIPLAYACFTGNSAKKSLSPAEKAVARQYWLKNSKSGRSVAEDSSAIPWGGNSAGWSAEAILANAVSAALKDGWGLPGVQDVLVAIPVKMMIGKVPNLADTQKFVVNRPYGDGQTNAHVTFGAGWTEKAPELVASLIQFKSGSPLVRFRFHSNPTQSGNQIEINYEGTTGKPIALKSKTPEGDLLFDWVSHATWGTLFENKVAFVRIVGSKTWFPIDFRNVMIANRDLLAGIPESLRSYGKGTLDPEKVSVQGQKTTAFPFQVMNPDSFASDLNAKRFFPVTPPGIHSGYYDDSGKEYTTAVGNGATTLFDSPQMDPPGTAPFKMAYICFDKRNLEAEKAGAPSGGGWHEIGDPAETVINSLENASVIFGYANGVPAAKTPDGDFDHGLTDIAVVRRVPPGSAIVTAAGPTSAQEERANLDNHTNMRGQGPASGRNYHWFIFDQPHEVCAVEWVHLCVPSATNQLGMNCSGN